MEFLRELVEIKRDAEIVDLLEELGNLGKLGLGPMVNAFKQTYSAWSRRGGGENKSTSTTEKKFSQQNLRVGKDSEAVEAGNVKNWAGLKRAYKAHSDDRPIAAIFIVDKKPVALLIGAEWDLNSVNDKVALSWDFSKVAPTKEESESLTKGLNTQGDSSNSGWRAKVVGGSTKLGASSRTDIEKSEEYSHKKGEYEEKFVTKKYAGFVQTVREIIPFVNNLTKTFGSRLEVSLILTDKVREAKRGERRANQPIDPKELKLFKDDLKTRLAKFKNSKADTAENAQEFIDKVLSGALKKLTFAGSTYSTTPVKKYIGSNDRHQPTKGYKAFYDGTMHDLISGKPVTMEFEADRKEADYNTLYLTVKMIKGSLVPVEMKYSVKGGKSEKVEF